jgi:hypothetical protein
MPLDPKRLRRWFAAAAIFVIAISLAYYLYGRIHVWRVVERAPGKMGVEIQQSTQGFTLSKSEAGRTIFTVHASNAVQYKEGGRAELHDVSILVYGRRSDRFDQIHGDNFEYDPKSGDIIAHGDVAIDLEGDAQGPVRPDQATPVELKNPIHLKTSGLRFNQKTGAAETREKIEFRTPQAAGSAVCLRAGLLDAAGRAHQVRADAQPADRIILHRPLRLDPIIPRGRHFHLAKSVLLLADLCGLRHSWLLRNFLDETVVPYFVSSRPALCASASAVGCFSMSPRASMEG